MRLSLAIISLLFSPFIYFSPEANAHDAGRSVTGDWQLSDIAVYLYASSFKEGCFLGKKVMIDDRPLYAESAIVLFRHDEGWILSQVYRHPRSEQPEKQLWRRSWASHTPTSNFHRTYSGKPSMDEISDFLDNNKFDRISSGWSILEFHLAPWECEVL